MPTDITTYTWNAQDQLIQISFPNSTTATYKYDGLGRRIEKDVDSFITRYVYDGEDILLEYSGTNTFVAHYSHGDQIDQPLVVQRAGLGFFYYHSDHQGSITHLTNTSGTIANHYVYDSYGRTMSVVEAVPQPYTYTGRERDAESGLYYYRARYYDSIAGRLLSEDPIVFQSGDHNLYRYVLNNPFNLNDPFGLVPPEWAPDYVIENTQNVVQSVTGNAFSDAELQVLTTLVIEAVDVLPFHGWLGDAKEVGQVNPFKFPVELTNDQLESLNQILDNVQELDLTSDQKTLVDRALKEYQDALERGDIKLKNDGDDENNC